MKKHLLTLAAVASLGCMAALGLSLADDAVKHLHHGRHMHHGGPGEMAAKHAEMIIEKLDLNAEQAGQVRNITSDAAKKMIALHSEGHPNPDDIHAIMDEGRQKIRAILTEEQAAQFDQMVEEHHGHHEKMLGMKEQLMPTVKEERRKFDKLLTTDEKETIAKLRNEVPAQHKVMHHHGKHMGSDDSDKDQAMRQKMMPLKAIAQAHEAELKEVFARVKAKMHGLCGDDCPDHLDHQKHHKHMMLVHFLLLDVDEDPLTSREELEVETYPNPAADQALIKFELKEDGPVRVEVIDPSGRVLKVYADGEREAGTYELPIDVSELDQHDYYVVLVSHNGRTGTSKLLRNR